MYIELKPCPFCGEKKNIDCGIMTGTIKGFVKCQNCFSEICSTHEYIDAFELWNRWEKVVQKQPAADVFEIVRCKDCKNYDNQFSVDNCGWCDEFNCGTSDERFCSYGERKEGADNVE